MLEKNLHLVHEPQRSVGVDNTLSTVTYDHVGIKSVLQHEFEKLGFECPGSIEAFAFNPTKILALD